METTTPTAPVKADTSGPSSPKEYTEKFPAFTLPSIKVKPRSLSQAEVQAGIMSPDDIDHVATSLKAQESPIPLEQARERRASVKEDRKICIAFLKRRTTSRAEALGRPNLEDLQQPIKK